MREEVKRELEQELLQYPILQYAFLKTGQVSFPDRVRTICRQECPQYGTSWSCPPAVGTVEACREKCLGYEGVLILSTVTEVSDIANRRDAGHPGRP